MLTLDGSPLLWNAHTGHKYDVQDTNCPLKSIGCVFNHENVRLLVQGSYFIRLLLILNGEFHGLLVLTTEEHLHFSGVLIHVFVFYFYEFCTCLRIVSCFNLESEVL